MVRVSGVHGLNIEDAPNTTLTEEHEHHVTLFPSLKPTSRKEVSPALLKYNASIYSGLNNT